MQRIYEMTARARKSVLGSSRDGLKIMKLPPEIEPSLVGYVTQLIEHREKSRAEKNYLEADNTRAELKRIGLLAVDGPEGTEYIMDREFLRRRSLRG